MRRVSVTVIVILALVTVTTLLMVTLGALNYVGHRERGLARLREELVAHANQLATGLELPVWNIDRPQIDRILEGLQAEPAVYAVVVEAADKTHTWARDSNWRLVPSSGTLSQPDLFQESRSITSGGETIGTLRLYATPRFVAEDSRRSLVSIVTNILALDLLLVLCLSILLWRTVLKPLSDIERYALAVKSGGGGEAVAIRGAGYFGELQSLRDSIEAMVRLLDARYAELREETALRLESEESLRRSQTMSAMGSLVAGVAHEVRNPLFSISASLDALEQELGHRPEYADYARVLRNQVARLTRLMRDLLDYGKPPQPRIAPAQPADLARRALRACAALAQAQAVALEATLAADLPPLSVDASRMEQVFENLLANAVQHSPQGGVVRLTALLLAGPPPLVEFRVEDDGPGIAAEDLPRLFTPFFSRRKGGTGLGLAIIQRIVEAHGGRITAANRSPRGALFAVTLPVTSAVAQPVAS